MNANLTNTIVDIEPCIEQIRGLIGKAQRAVVEAGHIYVTEDIGLEQRIGITIGRKIISELSKLEVASSACLFIDDVHLDGATLGPGQIERVIDRHVNELAKEEFSNPWVVRESALKDGALELAQGLLDNKAARRTKDGKIALKSSGITLVSQSGDPTCALLDAVLYIEKAKKESEDGALLITVLHERWRAQQENTKSVLLAAGHNLPILNFFYNDNGVISLDFE